jgi:hypothetical protein
VTWLPVEVDDTDRGQTGWNNGIIVRFLGCPIFRVRIAVTGEKRVGFFLFDRGALQGLRLSFFLSFFREEGVLLKRSDSSHTMKAILEGEDVE